MRANTEASARGRWCEENGGRPGVGQASHSVSAFAWAGRSQGAVRRYFRVTLAMPLVAPSTPGKPETLALKRYVPLRIPLVKL